MAITIPAATTAKLTALKAEMAPPRPPYCNMKRASEILRELTGLIDVTGLTVTGIHGAADATNAASSANATDQSSADTLADEIKADYNAHRVLTAGSVHGAADSTNVVTAANSNGTEPVLQTLVNDIRTQLIAHMALTASSVHGAADPNVVTLAAATDLTTDIALVNHLKAIYNAHIACIDGASTTTAADLGAFTGANSLIGATATFDGNVTAGLAGATGVVTANTTGLLTFGSALSTAPVTGDTFDLAYTAVDDLLTDMDAGKGLNDAVSQPYGDGRLLVDACFRVLQRLGSVPAYLTTAAGEPFGWGSPHCEGRQVTAALDAVHAAVAAYTVPA